MMRSGERRLIAKAYEQLGCGVLSDDWTGVDAILPLLERMREEGAVVLLKLDGERRAPGDALPYTVVVSESKPGGDTFRRDCPSLEEGLVELISWYGARHWGL